ncbi:MAG TPA: fused MFS/spermidine synthase [Gammaproteobacteria bacterium]|nr:fused MFS/spermidine synthase [Gammaproteobacteria bacterium]
MLCLFAASGCAALIYQVVWFEQLTLAIGSSAVSLGVLLATFLGGLGVGSLLASRMTSSRSAPLRRYALLELAVGVLGLVALWSVPLLGGAYAALAGTGALSLGLRLAVAVLTLLPATLLMGATLPIVAAVLRADASGAAWLGYCYAANTVGGVAGSVVAGFYLLRVHDAYVATFIAAALNLGCAAVAMALARGDALPGAARSAAVPAVQARTAASTRAVYVATLLSGMTALAAEVLWTRHLTLLLGGTVYTFALIVAVFLAGIGLGSVAGAAAGRRFEPRSALAACQAALGIAMASAAFALAESLPYWPLDVSLPSTASIALQLDTLRTAIVALPSALLWGASLPLALAAVVAAGEQPQRAIGRLYAANTLGAILGALGTTFVLVVAIGSQRTQQLMIVVSGVAALLVLRSTVGTRRFAAAAAVVAALTLAALSVQPIPGALVAFGRFLPTRGFDANVIYVGEGLTASVAVSEEPNGTLTYHNAGKTQASTYAEDMRLQRMLGHLTTLLVAQPRDVLVIGLGAGITAGAVSIDPAVERIVVAELEPLVPEVASEYFGAHNFAVVSSPKVEIRIDDGRHFLATTADRFDAITSDPLDPWVKGAAALYTREFWQLCKARLRDGGAVTVFVQLYETTEDAVRSELATFLDVFPNGAVFANTVEGTGYDAVLVGRKSDEPIDLTRLQQRFESSSHARVAESLRGVGFDSALDLMSTFAGDAHSLTPWLEGAQRNTDRTLRLQYLAGQGLNVLAAGEIYEALVGATPHLPVELFTGTPAQLEELEQRLAGRRGQY